MWIHSFMHVGNTIGYSNGMETGWKDENEHELYYGYAMLISQSDSIAVSQSHDRIVRFYTISILHSNSHCTKQSDDIHFLPLLNICNNTLS